MLPSKGLARSVEPMSSSGRLTDPPSCLHLRPVSVGFAENRRGKTVEQSEKKISLLN